MISAGSKTFLSSLNAGGVLGWIEALLRVCRSAWVTFGYSLRASRYMGSAHQARFALFFTHGWAVEAVCGLVWVISGGLRSLMGFRF